MGITPIATTYPTPPPVPTTAQIPPLNTMEVRPKINHYRFNDLETGVGWFEFTTYGGVNDYFRSKEHVYNPDTESGIVVITELFYDDYNTIYMNDLIKEIEQSYSGKENQARFIISMVQNIKYDDDRADCILNLCEDATDWQYPYETLYLNTGVCSDKSILMAYMLREIGYDVVLFQFECDGGEGAGHMAVGIKSGLSYDFRDTGYAYIESTLPTIITQEADSYFVGTCDSVKFSMIDVSDGYLMLDVSEEYQDAMRMLELETISASNDNTLEEDDYNEWENLCDKYGLLI